jgi:allantoicase
MQFLIDTLHFRNNSPVAFSLEACAAPTLTEQNFYSRDIKWTTLLPATLLAPHTEACFELPQVFAARSFIILALASCSALLVQAGHTQWTHVLLKIYPCGGVSRMRLFSTHAAVGPSKL